jgi:hypothetical protein
MAIENNIPNQISIPGSLTGRHEFSLINPVISSTSTTRMKSDIPTITLSPPVMKSLFEIQINPLSGRHDVSTTAPVTSILGANNVDSLTEPIVSTLTGRFDSSTIAQFHNYKVDLIQVP